MARRDRERCGIRQETRQLTMRAGDSTPHATLPAGPVAAAIRSPLGCIGPNCTHTHSLWAWPRLPVRTKRYRRQPLRTACSNCGGRCCARRSCTMAKRIHTIPPASWQKETWSLLLLTPSPPPFFRSRCRQLGSESRPGGGGQRSSKSMRMGRYSSWHLPARGLTHPGGIALPKRPVPHPYDTQIRTLVAFPPAPYPIVCLCLPVAARPAALCPRGHTGGDPVTNSPRPPSTAFDKW